MRIFKNCFLKKYKNDNNNDSKNNNYNGKREKKVKKIPPAERQLGDAVADKDNS